ncbi:MAG: glutamate 5-kinase [Collinsella sp.]
MVVKIGSSTVVGADGKVNRAFIGGLADQAAALHKLGWRLVVVSSGAIACGYPVLGFDRKPVGDLPSLQACASAGQCIISSAYDEEFHARDLLTSLVLLTRHDTARRTSYLHARDALLRLVELGVVPVVNENDTVTVDEIKFGDNDTLAALVSCGFADLCVTLSDIDGLYTANPHEDPTAEFIPVVQNRCQDHCLGGRFFDVGGHGRHDHQDPRESHFDDGWHSERDLLGRGARCARAPGPWRERGHPVRSAGGAPGHCAAQALDRAG